MTQIVTALVASALLAGAPGQDARAAADARSSADAEALAAFEKRLHDYTDLRKKLERDLGTVERRSTAGEIDDARKKLAQALAGARTEAQPGDIFVPAVQAYIRRVIVRAFEAPGGRQLRAAVLDDEPAGVAVRVNQPYPHGVARSTMPVKILEALPSLPEDLEYRFVGDRLILHDSRAGTVVDYIGRALP